jgi:Pretoxin HINT domain
VTRVFVHDVTSVIDLTIDGEVITTTATHPFWVQGLGWVHAEDLQVGTKLQTEDGSIVDVDGVQGREGDFKVYNFEVEGFHSYFVSDLGVLVHNDCTAIAKRNRSRLKGQGKIINITPKEGGWLPEPPNGYPDGQAWGYHDVFVKDDGMVYDPMGWGKDPVPLQEWLDYYGDTININDGPSRGT